MDMMSYVIGYESGTRAVVLTGGITCTDDGEENITVENTEGSDES